MLYKVYTMFEDDAILKQYGMCLIKNQREGFIVNDGLIPSFKNSNMSKKRAMVLAFKANSVISAKKGKPCSSVSVVRDPVSDHEKYVCSHPELSGNFFGFILVEAF